MNALLKSYSHTEYKSILYILELSDTGFFILKKKIIDNKNSSNHWSPVGGGAVLAIYY